jgi:hypothetical protein
MIKSLKLLGALILTLNFLPAQECVHLAQRAHGRSFKLTKQNKEQTCPVYLKFSALCEKESNQLLERVELEAVSSSGALSKTLIVFSEFDKAKTWSQKEEGFLTFYSTRSSFLTESNESFLLDRLDTSTSGYSGYDDSSVPEETRSKWEIRVEAKEAQQKLSLNRYYYDNFSKTFNTFNKPVYSCEYVEMVVVE